MTKSIKTGTRIEVRGIGLDFDTVWYPAKIGRWHPSCLRLRPGEFDAKAAGYHPVTYDDGCRLLVHESSFRVVDNRP
jgi:hypothetical protein